MKDLRFEMQAINEEEETYDSPQGSVWIVSVNIEGQISLLDVPNIHYSFFDGGMDPELVGFSPDVDLDPGVYRFTCNCDFGYDGYEYHGPDFYPTKVELLYNPLQDVPKTLEYHGTGKPYTAMDLIVSKQKLMRGEIK